MVLSSSSQYAKSIDSSLTIETGRHMDASGVNLGDLQSVGKKRGTSRGRNQKEAVVIETPFGAICGKHQLRAVVQTLALGTLLMGFGVFHVYSSLTDSSEDGSELRLLEEVEEEAECDGISTPWWQLLLYIIGILYTFLALAIVCDEFFVPALEELSGPHRMNLSMDVAGKWKSRQFVFSLSEAGLKQQLCLVCHVYFMGIWL